MEATWIDNRIEEDKKEQERRNCLCTKTEIIWNALLPHLTNVVRKYNEHFGSQPHADVEAVAAGLSLVLTRKRYQAGVDIHGAFVPVTLEIAMGEDGCSINAAGKLWTARVHVRSCVDQRVQFADTDDRDISIDEASRVLLETFLFDRRLA